MLKGKTAQKLKYNRTYESQADRIGGELMALAGYAGRAATSTDEALGEFGFRLSSEHTHPGSGIRWLEALKLQESLKQARHDESLAVMKRRTRAAMTEVPYDRAPGGPENLDVSPREWAASDPGAAPTTLDQFDAQWRLSTTKTWQVSLSEPPLSAAPATVRTEPGADALTLSDRLALRARTMGPQTSYAGAIVTGAYDWFLDGGWWRKSEDPAKPVPAGKGSKP